MWLATADRRKPRAPHVGKLTLRLMRAAQRTRCLKAASHFFQRQIPSQVRGFGWIPRTWYDRRARISRWLRFEVLRIHRGRRWRRLLVQRWTVGLSFGSFARTQTLAVFKKKSSAKKKRRKQAQPTFQGFDWRIQRIKDIKAGAKRRSSLLHDASVEAQLRGV